MGQYANYQEFISFGGIPEERLLTARPPVVPAEVEQFLRAASETVDSYIAIRYRDAVPLVDWGESVRDAVISLAAFKIMSRRIGFKPNGSDDSFEKDYDKTIQWLKDIGKGNVFLPGLINTPDKTDYGTPDVEESRSPRYDTRGHCDD